MQETEQEPPQSATRPYTPGNSIEEFHASKKLVRVLIGGRGSGKTYALAADIFRHIFWSAGAKAVVARHTETSNVATSIDTFKQFYDDMGDGFTEQGSDGLFRLWANPNKFRVPSRLAIEKLQAEKDAGRIKTKSDLAAWIENVGDRLCGTIEFKGLPDITTGESKLRGMECSYLALVEADQIERRFFELSFACLRWKGTDPATCDPLGYIVDRSLVLDTNPPGKGHWIAELESEQAKLPEAEKLMDFWHIKTDENEHNLPPNYIRDQIMLPYANNPAMIERMRYGQYADAFDGKPVYYAYLRHAHEAEDMAWTQGAYLVRSWDFGTHNAVIWSAYWEHAGVEYWHALCEQFLEGSDTDRQVKAALERTKTEFPFWNDRELCAGVLDFCDPAGVNSSYSRQIKINLNGKDTTVADSSVNILRTYKIYPGMRTVARGIQETIAVINRLLQKKDQQGRYCFRIDTKGCQRLTLAMQGGYRYPGKGEPGEFGNEPLKGELCGHLDHCFIAGTRILTAKGEMGIEDIAEGDEVFTRVGLRRVCATMNRPALVRDYTLSNKKVITATPDHPAWCVNQKSWIPFALLTPSDTLESCNQLQRSLSSMGEFIADTLTRTAAMIGFISNAARATCTKLFGRNTTARFQKGCTFTTGMKTPEITKYETSNCSHPSSTTLSMLLRPAAELLPLGAKLYARSPKHGMRRKPDGIGTETMPAKQTSERLSNARKRARIAVYNSPHGVPQEPSKPSNSAQTNASLPIVARLALTILSVVANCAARLSWIVNIPKRHAAVSVVACGSERQERVYNVTVEGQPEYYANGILVHNCADAFRYGAINCLRLLQAEMAGTKPPLFAAKKKSANPVRRL
jgi:Hint domain